MSLYSIRPFAYSWFVNATQRLASYRFRKKNPGSLRRESSAKCYIVVPCLRYFQLQFTAS